MTSGVEPFFRGVYAQGSLHPPDTPGLRDESSHTTATWCKQVAVGVYRGTSGSTTSPYGKCGCVSGTKIDPCCIRSGMPAVRCVDKAL